MPDKQGAGIDDAVAIAEDGDTILIVGPEKLHLRVYAGVQISSSPVFRAMFDPKWRQGQTKKNAVKPMVQPLEDDNATALHYLCALLHFRQEMVPLPLAGEEFVNVTVAADKYDMGKCLAQVRGFWVYSADQVASGTMMIAGAAYLLQNAKKFRRLTKWLVLNYSGPYSQIFNDKTESIMDWRVTWYLQEQRENAKSKIKRILKDGHRDMPECESCWRCSLRLMENTHYQDVRQRKEVWPSSSTSVSECIKRGRLMLDLTPPGLCDLCKRSRDVFIARQKENRAMELKSVKSNLGLCLDCVLSGEVDLARRCDHHPDL